MCRYMLFLMQLVSRSQFLAISFTAFAVFAATSLEAASGKRRNPTSKVFVADVQGESHIDTGDKIEPLTKKSVHSAEGSIIQTQVNSYDALVLSNGTAIYVAPETRFEVKKFMQEPFSPNRTDLEVEPSISQTVIKLVRGGLGVCTSKLVAGSSMVYNTPHASVNVRGRKVMIEVDDDETRVSLLEGDVTVLADAMSDGEMLRPGQMATVRKGASANVEVSITAIPEEALPKLDEHVSLACISRRTVYFEVVDRQAGNAFDAEDPSEIRPLELIPADLPTRFTISPARITD